MYSFDDIRMGTPFTTSFLTLLSRIASSAFNLFKLHFAFAFSSGELFQFSSSSSSSTMESFPKIFVPSTLDDALNPCFNHFFLKRSGGQAVRGSEAVRSAVSCAFFFATSCGDNFQALALTGGAARCLFDSVWRARVVTRMGLWGAAALASWIALFAAKLR